MCFTETLLQSFNVLQASKKRLYVFKNNLPCSLLCEVIFILIAGFSYVLVSTRRFNLKIASLASDSDVRECFPINHEHRVP
jgi:hypothetical protein